MTMVSLVFVPPGGGEADYQLQFDLPAVPQKGDYISVTRSPEIGTETFIVRRTIWQLSYPETNSPFAEKGEHGKESTVWVECEFARGAFNSEAHKNACNRYDAIGKNVPEQEATAY